MIHTIVASRTKLLLNLDKIGPADEANYDLLAEILEELDHIGRRGLCSEFSALTHIGMGDCLDTYESR